jgi:RimJ/RimL family protein N-acetyltransferase
MRVAPLVLHGSTVRLEPAGPQHASALWRGSDPEVFRYTLEEPRDASLPAFEEWLERSLALPDSLLFTIVLAATGEPIGTTGYLEIRPPHRRLEIGRTWIARAQQRTKVNPESKLLLLGHAFESLGAVRVELKTDLRNVQSQRAIEKLGAQREGVLRRYQTRSDGFVRDTVVYSIVSEEWPAVRSGLLARLVGQG